MPAAGMQAHLAVGVLFQAQVEVTQQPQEGRGEPSQLFLASLACTRQ